MLPTPLFFKPNAPCFLADLAPFSGSLKPHAGGSLKESGIPAVMYDYHSLSEINHWVYVDISHQTDSSGNPRWNDFPHAKLMESFNDLFLRVFFDDNPLIHAIGMSLY